MSIHDRNAELDTEEEDETVFDRANLLTNQIKSDIESHGSFKLKLMKTLALCAAFLGLGLCFAVLGPTLLDLKCHVSTDIPHISLVFTGRSLGYLLGSIIGGFLFDKFNQLLLLSFALFVTSLATGLVPWSSHLMVLFIAIGVQGLTMGFLDTGGNVLCLTLWGRKSGPFMQALHFSFGIGAFISPLIAQPFLGVYEVCQNINSSIISSHSSYLNNKTLASQNETFNITTSHLLDNSTLINITSLNLNMSASSNVDSKQIAALNNTAMNHVLIKNRSLSLTKVSLLKQPSSDHINKREVATVTMSYSTTIATLNYTSISLTTSFKSDSMFGNIPTKEHIHTTVFSNPNRIISSSILIFPATTPPFNISSTITIAASSFSTLTPLTNTVMPFINVDNNDSKKFLIISRIQFAYLIIAIFIFQTSIAFLVFFGIGSHSIRAIMPVDIKTQGKYSISSLRFQLLGLLFIFYFMYIGMEATYGGLIMTFAFYSKLNLSKSIGAYITSLFWGMFALARGFAIYFAKQFPPAVMLRTNLFLCIVASVLLFFAETHSWILWFGSGLLGVGMASIFPTGITWVEQYIDLSHKEASILVVGSALGEMLLPALAGHFFNTIKPMFLMYLILSLCILCLIVYIFLEKIADNYGDKYTSLLSKKQTTGRSKMEDKMENEPLVESVALPVLHESSRTKTVRFTPPPLKWTKITKNE